MQAHPDRLVFIDETSIKTNLTSLRGRSLCGKRLEMTAPFGAWGTQTFIAGLTHDSLIAPWVIKGAMNGEAFATYIRQVLAPELLLRSRPWIRLKARCFNIRNSLHVRRKHTDDPLSIGVI